MKRENAKRVDEIISRLHMLERDIENLEHIREKKKEINQGNFSFMGIELTSSSVSRINLLDIKKDYDKISELIDYSLRTKRKEYIELEEELETL